MKAKRYTAFTLAEVLITLGIIGIVAAMTIPTLIANYQKQVYVTQLKKEYTLWNQVLQQMALDNGTPGDLSGIFDSNNLTNIGNKIAPYFKVVKNCNTLLTGCFPNITSDYIDGSSPVTGVYDSNQRYRFILASGVAVALGSFRTNCASANGNLTNICADYLQIDVNGMNKPNSFGRDIFTFVIDNSKGPTIYPYGGGKLGGISSGPWPNNGMCSNGSKNGTYCAGRIIYENWQMNY